MSALDLSHAPGCYGSILTYKEDAPECRSCPFEDLCGSIAEERYIALCTSFGLPAKQPVRRKRVVAVKDVPPPERLRAQERMTAAQVIKIALQRGINPFKRQPELKLIAGVLLRSRTPVTDRVLALVFRKQLDKSLEEADRLVEEKLLYLLSVDAIERQGDVVVIKRVS